MMDCLPRLSVQVDDIAWFFEKYHKVEGQGHSHMAGAMQGKTLPEHASKHTSCVQKGVKDSCS
jgi:hypothetical protein